jgi:hypothetical protein
VKSGANQLLIVIDACFSGAAVNDAVKVASALLAERARTDDRVWFGILVSCNDVETARDGTFGAVLHRLLTQGPRRPITRVRWSPQNRLIKGEDLGDAAVDPQEWPPGFDQTPGFVRAGAGMPMIPNPLWEPNASEQVVEHLLRSARGSPVGDDRSWFTGRVAEIDTVVGWIRSGAPGVRVVTGSPQTGKSAIVGRVVSLSNPIERARLESEGDLGDHADPGQQSVHAHIHARGLTADQAAARLDAQLVRTIVSDFEDGSRSLLQSQADPRNALELVGGLQRVHQRGFTPVIVVDGLDEALGEAFKIAENLLARLATYANVIVSTRPISRGDPAQSVLEVLASVAVLNLDDSPQRQSQLLAMRDYIQRALGGVSASMDPVTVANEFVARIGDRSGSFLLARIVVDQLRAAPVDTAAPNWENKLAGSIQDALDIDLGRISAPPISLRPIPIGVL